MSDRSAAILQGDYQSMYSPLSAIVRRAPVTVGPEASVREALETMERERVGSVIVTRPEDGAPLGIFTLHDLLRRVALAGNDLAQPVIEVMPAGLAVLLLLRRNRLLPGAVVVLAAATLPLYPG